MSLIEALGIVESGLVFGLVALAVYLSFRVLDFPDLTVDGSFTTGAAVAATGILNGIDPVTATLLGIAAAALAGALTAWLSIRLEILHLLASILVMIGLYSVNLRIMGRPNQSLLGAETVFTPLEGLGLPYFWAQVIVLTFVVALVWLLLLRFLSSELGLAMRASGINKRMSRAQGINTRATTILGLALANGLVGLAGALLAQIQGGADITMGVGVIIVGLAAVILGEVVLPARRLLFVTLACLLGSLIYRAAVSLALHADFIGLQAQDLKLVTAILVIVSMTLPVLRRRRRSRGA